VVDTDGLSWKGYEGQDYETFWTGPGKRYLDALEQAIVARTLAGGDAVVEIGAGFGRLGRSYVSRYRQVHMVEPASNLRAIAARTYGDAVTYHDASVLDLPFRESSFDAALMVRVFHHLRDPEKALRELYRVLKPKGILVFNYSNRRNIRRIAGYLIGRTPSPFNAGAEQYNPALIGHTPTDVEALLRDIGFGIQSQYGVGLVDKLVERFPPAGRIVKPSLLLSRLAGALKMSPAQFVVAEKR
jgi:SAM-dependent methyltransferase